MFDLILKGGVVVDGTRKAPYPANVCIADGKIALITTQDAEAAETLDISRESNSTGLHRYPHPLGCLSFGELHRGKQNCAGGYN